MENNNSRMKFIQDGNNYVTSSMGNTMVHASIDRNEVKSLKNELDNVDLNSLTVPEEPKATPEQISQAMDFQRSIIANFRNSNTNINRGQMNDSRLKPRANNPYNNTRTLEENKILQVAANTGLTAPRMGSTNNKYENYISFSDEDENSIPEELRNSMEKNKKANDPTDYSDCEMTFDD